MPERNDCNFLNIEIQDMTSRPKLISIVSGIQLNGQNLINPNIFSYFVYIFNLGYKPWAVPQGMNNII